MGKITKKGSTNNSKKIIISSIFCIVTILFLALGLCLYKANYSIMYVVKYVHWNDEIEIQKYYKGEKINFPEPPEILGYNFVGWSLDSNDDQIVTNEICIESEMTLYARWEEKTFNLKYNDECFILTYNDQFVIDNDKITITDNKESILIEADKVINKKFIYWNIYDGLNYYNLLNFKFDKSQSHEFELIPVYDDIKFAFTISGNCDEYSVADSSHTTFVSISDILTFTIVLNECVDNSNITISTTSGTLDIIKNNAKYYVTIKDFNNDFKVEINNITINTYKINIIDENNYSSYLSYHGDKLSLPNLTKKGYKLLGFKDSTGRFYTNEYVICQNLDLYAIWEIEEYKITFPKTNGIYFITIDNEKINSNKDIIMHYGDKLEFKITISNAYDCSSYNVIARTKNEDIILDSIENNTFTICNIESDIEIFINDITLNKYALNVDGVYYGNFSYGSWITVEDDSIIIKDSYSNNMVQIYTMIYDNHFNGWTVNNSILTNCMVQEITNQDMSIEIYGNYSKKICRVQLIANGGILDITEIVLIEGENITLPEPIKWGYTFAGWYTKLVEVNTLVDGDLSIKFNEITDFCITLYAGWTK